MVTGLNVKVAAAVAAMVLSAGVEREAPFKIVKATLPHHAPLKIHRHRENTSWDSSNWSGYAVTSSTSGAVTSVSGSWVVPAVTCSSGLGDSSGYAAFWVGIDGFSSNTVEQIGTDSDCVDITGRHTNTPTYYAWFEFYPAGSYLILFNRPIKVGDVIQAQVTYTGTSNNTRHGKGGPQFTVTLTDVTQNETYSTSSTVSSAQQTSAEWIAEAPCCTRGGGVLPLADFAQVNFTSGQATISGSTGTIDTFTGNIQDITMEDQGSTVIKAKPSAPPPTGGNFSVTWMNAGP